MSERRQKDTEAQTQKIVHLSSVHPVHDTRIFHKECKSLAAAGYEVKLIARGYEDRRVEGVTILSLPPDTGGRLTRMTRTVFRLFRMALRERADLYHLHDPELLPVGLFLKASGKHVLFDAHEHVAKQIESKEWLPQRIRKPLALAYRCVERLALRVFDGVVVADPTQVGLYPDSNVCVVENFPKLEEFFTENPPPYQEREHLVTYVGGLSRIRGLYEMLQSIEIVNQRVDATLVLAGNAPTETLRSAIESAADSGNVRFDGFLGRPDVVDLLSRSRIGIVVLHPVPNYVTSQPVKLLEYMLAGLPVVVCDFPYYRQYVDAHKCGLMVDPLDPAAISDAIVWLLKNPEEAQAMGERGREAVLRNYLWSGQAKRLIEFYESVLGSTKTARQPEHDEE